MWTRRTLRRDRPSAPALVIQKTRHSSPCRLPLKPASTNTFDISSGKSVKLPVFSPSALPSFSTYFALNTLSAIVLTSRLSPPVKERKRLTPGPRFRLLIVSTLNLPPSSITIGWKSLISKTTKKIPMPSISKNWL